MKEKKKNKNDEEKEGKKVIIKMTSSKGKNTERKTAYDKH